MPFASFVVEEVGVWECRAAAEEEEDEEVAVVGGTMGPPFSRAQRSAFWASCSTREAASEALRALRLERDFWILGGGGKSVRVFLGEF